MRAVGVLLLFFCVRAAGQEERARDLATASAEVVDKNPDLAVLLAREALTLADIEPARTALYAAIAQTRRRTVLKGHEGAVTCCDIAPDGQLLATGSEDGTARLWTPAGQPSATLLADAAVREVRFLGSAERVMVATEATLSIWDRAGQKLTEFPAVSHALTAGGLLLLPEGQARFVSSDGKVLRELAVVHAGVGAADIAFHAFTSDGRVRWYDRAGREKAVRPASGTSRAVISAWGNVIATFGSGKDVELWSPDGKKLGELAHGGAVEQVSVSATGENILTAAADGQYAFWTGAGKLVRRVPKQGPSRFVAASLGDGVSIASDGDRVTVWFPTLSGIETVSKRIDGGIRRVEASGSGHAIMVETEDGRQRFHFYANLDEVKVRNRLRGALTVSRWGNFGDWQLVGDDAGAVGLQSWGLLGVIDLRGHTDAILDACFSSDERCLLTASRDRTAMFSELDPPEMPVLEHWTGVNGVAYADHERLVTFDWAATHFRHADGRLIRTLPLPDHQTDWTVGSTVAIACNEERTARIFDLDGKEIAKLSHDGVLSGLTSSWGEGETLASYSSEERIAKFWSATTGKPLRVLQHPCGVDMLGFGPDGSLLTTGVDGTARIWSPQGKLRAEFPASEVFCFVWSPAGDRIATLSSESSTVSLWTPKGKEIGRLAGHDETVNDLDISDDGATFVTASDDKTARLWDKDGRPGPVLPHSSTVYVVNFVPGKQEVVTGCLDGTVRHWSADGKLRGMMKTHTGKLVVCAAITADGRWLATGSDDRTVRIWPLQRDDLLRIAKDRVPRDFTPTERERFAALLAK